MAFSQNLLILTVLVLMIIAILNLKALNAYTTMMPVIELKVYILSLNALSLTRL